MRAFGMIRSWKSEAARQVFAGQTPKGFPADLVKPARRRVRARQPVTPDTALRLARVFGTSAQFWMNLQAQHDLSVAALAARDELAALRPLPTPDAA